MKKHALPDLGPVNNYNDMCFDYVCMQLQQQQLRDYFLCFCILPVTSNK